MSAGNHAQGVALAAGKLGVDATIVMPKFAPEIKVENVKRLGGKVILHGDDFDAAKKECARLVAEKNLIFIPPFDGTSNLSIYKFFFECSWYKC